MMATTSSGTTKEQLQALQEYTACDIADALLKLKVPNAGFLPDLHLFAPYPSSIKTEITIAPASTVIFALKHESNASDVPEANIPAGKHWVDLTQPETIVVMKQPEGQKCAIIGGIMALRMKVLGARGVVVNGRVRDLVELRETGLPVRILSFALFFILSYHLFRALAIRSQYSSLCLMICTFLLNYSFERLLGASADEAIRYGQNQLPSWEQGWRLNPTLFKYLSISMAPSSNPGIWYLAMPQMVL
jgi:regulator of RNase E activity RraA